MREHLPVCDPQRRCAKCGGDASLEFKTTTVVSYGYSFDINGMRLWVDYPGGVILRRCTRCNHQWYEAPLDWQEPTEEERTQRLAEQADAQQAMRQELETRMRR